MDISSVIVGARPERAPHLKFLLEALDGVEVHAVADDGRMIVTIEAASERDTATTYETIALQPGVLSVAMVYHQIESNPDEEA